MAAVRQVVVLNDREIRDALIERAKVAINGKSDGPGIQGSSKVELLTNDAGGKGEYRAEVSFERVGGKA